VPADSAVKTNGNPHFKTTTPECLLKQAVAKGTLRLLVGTDAAAEGLNLQRLGSLINLDLPWNPTRLEQRKGRIQRIGQARSLIFVANLRYRGSVEDQVHQVLGDRLRSIHALFGQIPDILETAWIQAAVGDIEAARQTLDRVPTVHPFQHRYMPIARVEWESCKEPLTRAATVKALLQRW
jgi:hypothetical protein